MRRSGGAIGDKRLRTSDGVVKVFGSCMDCLREGWEWRLVLLGGIAGEGREGIAIVRLVDVWLEKGGRGVSLVRVRRCGEVLVGLRRRDVYEGNGDGEWGKGFMVLESLVVRIAGLREGMGVDEVGLGVKCWLGIGECVLLVEVGG